MRILPVVSIALIAAGLVLILYSDPVLATPTNSQTGPPGGITGNSTGTLPPGCQRGSTGGIQCGGGPGGNGGNGELVTLFGLALCGGGIVANVVEAVAKEGDSGPRPVS